MAADLFLKLDSIDGESTDSKYAKYIELHSWSWGESNAATLGSATGGAGTGKVNMSDFSFTTSMSKASPALFNACATGKHIASASFVARKAGDKPLDFLTIKFTDVFITSYNIGGSGGSDLPMDAVSFAFHKLEWSYNSQSEKGVAADPVKAGFDLKTNQKV